MLVLIYPNQAEGFGKGANGLMQVDAKLRYIEPVADFRVQTGVSRVPWYITGAKRHVILQVTRCMGWLLGANVSRVGGGVIAGDGYVANRLLAFIWPLTQGAGKAPSFFSRRMGVFLPHTEKK
jgi:hypothetical protein